MLASLFPTINLTNYYTPMIFSWLQSGTAFFLAFLIFKKWKSDKTAVYFGWFWLMVGFCWISNAVFSIFAGLDMLLTARATVYIIYIFAILQAPFLAYYLIMSLSSNEKAARVFSIIYALYVSVFVFFLIEEGIAGPVFSSEWGIKFHLLKGGYAALFLKIAIIPLFFLALFDLLKRIFDWARKRYLANSRFLVSSLAIIIYLAGGYFEGMGGLPVWQYRFVKLAILAAILMTYLAYYLAAPKESKLKPLTKYSEIAV